MKATTDFVRFFLTLTALLMSVDNAAALPNQGNDFIRVTFTQAQLCATPGFNQ